MLLNIQSKVQEKILFISRFIHSPGQIGSVTPSSRYLARKMIDAVPWDQVHAVAELGAGTGAITKYIQAAVREGAKVVLFEKDPYLQKKLQHEFPKFTCYTDGCELQSVLEQEDLVQLECVISGLPFYNFPKPLRDRLIEQIRLSLNPGGLFVAFQYSLQMKQQLSDNFEIKEILFVPMNVPPAFIYVCQKETSADER
ncbi:class I SAM-dependent methyltransferase [Paenibacillus antarcticus]|uniref:Phospholipid methyltransferase n=1 Tax=Paenibacillus antarcticus TaxID=253703 RepID=A0A168P7F8_9BACL|nr:phospholipid methyltransferase [Paenibacillus antarcticus]OAB46463.1 phospholipid methyltransferase [Paenibacillus antarcticus]